MPGGVGGVVTVVSPDNKMLMLFGTADAEDGRRTGCKWRTGGCLDDGPRCSVDFRSQLESNSFQNKSILLRPEDQQEIKIPFHYITFISPKKC